MVIGELTHWMLRVTLSDSGSGTLKIAGQPTALQAANTRDHVGGAVVFDEGNTYTDFQVIADGATAWGFYDTFPSFAPSLASGDNFSASGVVRP